MSQENFDKEDAFVKNEVKRRLLSRNEAMEIASLKRCLEIHRQRRELWIFVSSGLLVIMVFILDRPQSFSDRAEGYQLWMLLFFYLGNWALHHGLKLINKRKKWVSEVHFENSNVHLQQSYLFEKEKEEEEELKKELFSLRDVSVKKITYGHWELWVKGDKYSITSNPVALRILDKKGEPFPD